MTVKPTPTGRIIPVTASRSLALADQFQILESRGSTEVVLSIPLRATVNFDGKGRVDLAQFGAGAFTVDPVEGVQLNGGTVSLHVAGQHKGATLYERGPNQWEMIGGVL